ncbi:MAG TPA: YtzH-like family protein [Bacillota bacterium]|nr:YtzH-like family protein [Bacillota bacterium]
MTLTYHNQLKLLHDLLDEQLIYQTSDTSEFTQIKRLVQAIMAERSIEHTPLKQYLPEIYGYGIAGERIQCDYEHITTHRENIYEWKVAILQSASSM